MAKTKSRAVKGAKRKPSAVAQAEQNDRVLRRSIQLQRRIKANARVLVRACVASERELLDLAIVLGAARNKRLVDREEFERLLDENHTLRRAKDERAMRDERLTTPGAPEEG